MSQQIAVRLADDDLARVDAAIARGAFPSRAAAVRAGLELVLKVQRDHDIAEQYRRGYGAHPQEEGVGALGLGAAAALVAREANDEDPPA